MTDVLLFHHAQGLTDGVNAFADRLRQAGHRVTAPDLYDGHTYATLEQGMAHAREAGFQVLVDRGVAAADGLPDDLVYVGLSLGVMPAQQLTESVAGAELFVYPGDQHLFVDSSLSDHRPEAAELLTARVLDFLA